jgi:hypothetical protein
MPALNSYYRFPPLVVSINLMSILSLSVRIHVLAIMIITFPIPILRINHIQMHRYNQSVSYYCSMYRRPIDRSALLVMVSFQNTFCKLLSSHRIQVGTLPMMGRTNLPAMNSKSPTRPDHLNLSCLRRAVWWVWWVGSG